MHEIKITQDKRPLLIGYIKITKRGKSNVISFSTNIDTKSIFFNPAVIDGVRVEKIWADEVRKYVKKYIAPVNNEFIYSRDEILGVQPVTRYFTGFTNGSNILAITPDEKKNILYNPNWEELDNVHSEDLHFVSIEEAEYRCKEGLWKELFK